LFQLVHITSWASRNVLSPKVSGDSDSASAKREAYQAHAGWQRD